MSHLHVSNTMPLQLRAHSNQTFTPSPPSPTTPRLIPLSAPAKRPRRAHVRRSTAILALVAALLLIPTLLSALTRSRSPNFPVRTIRFKPLQNHSTPAEQPAPDPDDVQRPRSILVVTTYGGVGNQVYFLLEALHLARRAGMHLVVPSVPSRSFGKRVGSTPELSGTHVWNLPVLSKALSPGARVLPGLPDACEARFDAVYVASRSKPRGKAGGVSVGSRARQAACFLVEGYEWGDEVPPRNEWECADRMFGNAAVERRVQPLKRPPDEEFVEELGGLQGLDTLPSGVEDARRPACALVDGHSFNVGGREGLEYLHSYMHYLEPSQEIASVAARWKFDSLAVLHIRYDERECVGSDENKNKVCVRVAMGVGEKGTVYWAPVEDLVSVVVTCMKAKKARLIYISASPYVPVTVAASLREKFAERVKLAPEVDRSVALGDQNFIERELAIRARCFIGDFASTWSGTVYYKRRTLGKTTLWSSELLGQSKALGYYARMDKIPGPEDFERRWIKEPES